MAFDMKHLNDEHMRLYEWCGIGTGAVFGMPAKSGRTRPWHASFTVLAILATLLMLNGCNSDTSAELTREQAALEAQGDEAPPSSATTAQPAPGEAAALAAGGETGTSAQDAQQP